MSPLRVFPDTGALFAMIVFPRGKKGHPTLAGEVLDLWEAGTFELVISRVVIDELEEVIERDFPGVRSRVTELLAPSAGQWTRWPTPEEIADALPFTTDPEDAPIFAAARIARPDIVLSNDFRAFHAPLARTFRERHHIRVESLYGLQEMRSSGWAWSFVRRRTPWVKWVGEHSPLFCRTLTPSITKTRPA